MLKPLQLLWVETDMGKRGYRKKGKEKPFYDGVEFDSIDEVQFYMWLKAAEKAGLVGKWIYHPPTIEVLPAFKEKVVDVIQLKTKSKVVERTKTILHNASYTPDFQIFAIPDSRIRAFFRVSSDGTYWVDVKGKFSGSVHGGEMKYFSLLTKVLWYLKHIFINKIIVRDLTEATFCPDELKVTKTGKPSTIFKGHKTLKEFIHA